MTSPQKLIADQLVAWLQADVEDADGWTFHRTLPRDYSAGQNCAIYWLGDEPFPDDSTTAWLGLADAYVIQYWEPATDPSRAKTDEDAEELVTETLQQVRRAVLLHRGLSAGQLANAFELAYLGSRRLGNEDAASSVRGFEVTVRVRRPEAYS